MKKFEVGKTYVTHHLLDDTVPLKMTVESRTEKTLRVRHSYLGKATRRVFYDGLNDCESVNAPGGYASFDAINEEKGKIMEDDLISRSALSKVVGNIDWHSANEKGILHEGAADEESAFLRYSEVAAAIESAPVVQKLNLSHVKMSEAKEFVGPYETDMVILFNINRISHAEAIRCAQAGEYNKNVLCIPKQQYVALFQDGKEL